MPAQQKSFICGVEMSKLSDIHTKMSSWEIVETDYADRDESLSEGAPERLNNYSLLELLGKGEASLSPILILIAIHHSIAH